MPVSLKMFPKEMRLILIAMIYFQVFFIFLAINTLSEPEARMHRAWETASAYFTKTKDVSIMAIGRYKELCGQAIVEV